MARLDLHGIEKRFGTIDVLRDVNLSIADGEFIVLVGPSGCGKSTLLRMIAGLEDITAGDFLIDGQRMNDVAPRHRDIAMVFQSYALYPHMDVARNMGFSMEIRGAEKSARAAIAETGGFVVCTNEGNADMGTGLVRLHIACMGFEKLLPRASDLGVFLRLLARSATGQPITTYSTHFHGPIQGGELHIVLVDNGRSNLLGREKFRRALNCIRCGACMNTCPVYRRSGGHSYQTSVPGPIGSILAPARDPQTYKSLPHACSLCGSCTEVCPVKIDLHHQLLTWRKKLAARHLLSWSKRKAMQGASFVFRHPALYRFAGALARRIVLVTTVSVRPKIPFQLGPTIGLPSRE